MSNEIKEILDDLKKYVETSKIEAKKCKDGYIIYPTKLGFKPCILLLDYITNLRGQIEEMQEEIDNLKNPRNNDYESIRADEIHEMRKMGEI